MPLPPLPAPKADSARTGHITTVRGYDIYQDSPDGDAWFALPPTATPDDEGALVTYDSLGELLRAIRAAGEAPA